MEPFDLPAAPEEEAHFHAPASLDDAANAHRVLLIEQWFAENFGNSAISRLTECWNIAIVAKEKLIVLLTSGA